MSDDQSRIHRWTVIGSLAGVGALILGFVAYVYPPGTLGSGSTSSTTPTSTIISTTNTTTTSTSSTTEPPPPPPPQPTTSKADVTVVQHALLEGPRGQGQVKVKVTVTNRSNIPLNASIGNMRLLLRGATLPGPWTPRAQTADWSVVNIDGNSYVAIPANGNKQWEAEYATFASFWWASTLQPGETYSGAGKDNGDLVFYPPADQNGSVPFGGVALVTNDGGTVLGWTENLGAEGDPRTF